MRGAIFYNKEDYVKNSDFAEWMRQEFNGKNVKIDLYFLQDFYQERKFTLKYDFVINRTRDFNLSQLFEINGIRVFNNSELTLLGNNKYSAYLFAKNNNFEIPQIPICPQGSILYKPIYGHGGSDIDILSNNDILFNGNNIYQEFLKDLAGDIRFYVINNEIYKAVKRYSHTDYVFNYSKGGEFCEYKYSPSEYKLVNSMISLLKIDYAGLDFFITKDGKLIFYEIEDVVGSRMLSVLGENNTVPLFVEHIINSI